MLWWGGLITKYVGLGYFRFLSFCPEEFHRALLGCAK